LLFGLVGAVLLGIIDVAQVSLPKGRGIDREGEVAAARLPLCDTRRAL
jgi:hypothetical protein